MDREIDQSSAALPSVLGGDRIILITVGSGITVLNAIATGYGATIGTKPVHQISISVADSIEFDTGDPSISPKLLISCLKYLGRYIQIPLPQLSISVRAAYPPARGLKTSSAISCGLISGINQLLNLKLSLDEVVSLSADASIATGVSITGAIDDAYGSLEAGLWITDNTNRKVISHQLVERQEVILLLPQASTPKSSIKLDLNEFELDQLNTAKEKAIHGDWKEAVRINSSVYGTHLLKDVEILDELNTFGLAGMNGAGPSLFLIPTDPNTSQLLAESYPEYEQHLTSFR